MAGVSKEQITEAKKIDLLTYMQQYEPNAIKKCGMNEWLLKEHDSLKMSNGKWNWFSRGIGGRSALDFFVRVRGMDFVEAVRLLAPERETRIARNVRPPPAPEERTVEKERSSRPVLPEKNALGTEAVAYLKNRRGIDGDIIVKCLSNGSLYEGRYGMKDGGKKTVCVFVGKDSDDEARYAFLRGIGKNDNFKGDAEGSDKSYGFSFKSDYYSCRYLIVTESAIDAMSVASIMKLNAGNAWERYAYLSLGGVSPAAGIRYLKDNPGITKVYLCLDNDEAGRKGREAFRAAAAGDGELRERSLEFVDRIPLMKDYNEELRFEQSRRENHTGITKREHIGEAGAEKR
jgi:hypothetical protein